MRNQVALCIQFTTYPADFPPSTESTRPVVKDALSEQRNTIALAIWSDSPTRPSGSLLQPARNGGAVDQRRQGRDQVHPTVVQHLRRERRPPTAPCSRLSATSCEPWRCPRRSARKTHHNRRQGGEPWPPRLVPTRGGRDIAADVQGNSDAHRPAAGAARTSVRVLGQMRQTTTAKVCLDEATQRIPAPRDNPSLRPPTPPVPAGTCCHGRLKTRQSRSLAPESGECRLRSAADGLAANPVLGKIQVEVGSSINNFYKTGGN